MLSCFLCSWDVWQFVLHFVRKRIPPFARAFIFKKMAISSSEESETPFLPKVKLLSMKLGCMAICATFY